ncbi:MAG: D-alanyl-D-alanine carboxypeptidase [Betaproteobacteria bacterium]|nr:MAG: D-alanyl-D-alanine carboxypeptidase [Betaproteobacteria bacterium]
MKFLISLLFFLSASVHGQATPTPPSVAAKSFLLYDFQSGQTLAAVNPDERVEPASLTKVMTAYLAFNALKHKTLKPDQVVPVSHAAWKAEGSRTFIEPRTPVTVDELLRGMIVQSGNDASIALAEAIAGSEESFAQMMNKEAKRLGLASTNFVNSTGLPHPQHYSTAADLAKLAAALIRDHPEYYPLYSIKDYTYNKIKQPNRNRLLWSDPSVDGMKTGHTKNAGWCLISSAKRGERRLVSVVLGADSSAARAAESQKLLNFGFQFYDTVRLYEKGQSVASLKVWKGSTDSLSAGFEQDLYFSLPKGQAEKLKATLESQQPLVAPVAAGQRVGTMKITLDGKPLTEVPVVAIEKVELGNIFARGWDAMRLFFK